MNEIIHTMHEVPAWVVWAPTIAMAAGFLVGLVLRLFERPRREE